MSQTKRFFVTSAFEELGMAEYVFDMSPEAAQSALRRLDSMMAELNGRYIRLGYPIPADTDSSDLDEVTEIPDWATEAIITGLALRLAPSYGKTPSSFTVQRAKASMAGVILRLGQPPTKRLDALPAGAGNKPSSVDGTSFIGPTEDTIDAGPDGPLEI